MSAAHKDDQVLDLGSEKYSGYHSAILLASVALTAFAGAAAAEVSFSGDAALGYNDTIDTDATTAGVQAGMYWNADLDVAFSQELDNGITAAANVTLNIADDAQGQTGDDIVGDNWKVSLTAANGSLVYGDTEFAAVSAWKSAGDMANDGFREIGAAGSNLKGSVTLGGATVAVSYDAAAGADLGTVDAAVTATVGAASVVAAYQEGVAGGIDELFGLSVATSMGGADVTLAYANNNTDDTNSIGVKVAYTVADVKATAFYVAESDAAREDGYGLTLDYTAGALSLQGFYANVNDLEETRVQGSYDMGNGLVITAGSIDGDSTADDDFANYLVAEYDLGGGAALMASFVDGQAGGVNSTDIDTFGGYELNDGTTIELSFAF